MLFILIIYANIRIFRDISRRLQFFLLILLYCPFYTLFYGLGGLKIET